MGVFDFLDKVLSLIALCVICGTIYGCVAIRWKKED